MENITKQIIEIFDRIIYMNLPEALKYENSTTRAEGTRYLNAIDHRDDYLIYHDIWEEEWFKPFSFRNPSFDVRIFLKNPTSLPLELHEHVRILGRNKLIKTYVESNNYFRMLNGTPDVEDNDIITLPKEFYDALHEQNSDWLSIPIHTVPEVILNQFIRHPIHSELLKKYPSKKYLEYLGNNSIPISVSRRANDMSIIRFEIPTNKNHILLRDIYDLYEIYRSYVFQILYRPEMDDIHPGMRGFIHLLIKTHTIFQVINEYTENSSKGFAIDEQAMHRIISEFNFNGSDLSSSQERINLIRNVHMLIHQRGTDKIYPIIFNILGIDEYSIDKLILTKDENGPFFISKPVIGDNEISRFEYKDIIQLDNEWWDTSEVSEILNRNNYHMVPSKYATTTISLRSSQYIPEMVLLIDGILRGPLKHINLMVPDSFDSTEYNLKDWMLFILASYNKFHNIQGIIDIKPDLFSVYGFNYSYYSTMLMEFIENSKYINKERLILFLNSLGVSDDTLIVHDVILVLRDWLINEITTSVNLEAQREYQAIYQALFNIDSLEYADLTNFTKPLEEIRLNYNITIDDMEAFKHFYPRDYYGSALTIEKYPGSRYDPFSVVWFIEIPFSGILYFHDILNSPDLRFEYDRDGNPIGHNQLFYNGDELDMESVVYAINTINDMNDHLLNRSVFKTRTHMINNKNSYIEENTLLPIVFNGPVWKKILTDKINKDIMGFAERPLTFSEILRRRNYTLWKHLSHDLFVQSLEYRNKILINIIEAIERKLDHSLRNMKLKFVNEEMYHNTYMTLLNRFKSMNVKIIKNNMKHIIDDKIDFGGEINMLTVVDKCGVTTKIVVTNNSNAPMLSLYDTATIKRYIHIDDTLSMNDDVTFFRNGKSVDHEIKYIHKKSDKGIIE